jgi:hypothetical protein
LVGAGSKAGV